jgi:hypothetical protein
MKTRLRLPWLLGAGLLAACAGARGSSVSPVPADVDPLGRYDFTMTDDGKPATGSMTVTGTPGAYTGQIKTDTRPTVAITMLATSGPVMIVTADVPQGVLVVRMRFVGDSVSGNWALRSSGGRISGRRVSSAP